MAPKNPTRVTTDLVDERDDRSCVRCGISLEVTHGSRHHRQLRRHGDHGPANLVLLCGSGTSGCHGWVHAHPVAGRDQGLMLMTHQAPTGVPIYRWCSREWMLHDDEGNRTMITAEHAFEIREELGIS